MTLEETIILIASYKLVLEDSKRVKKSSKFRISLEGRMYQLLQEILKEETKVDYTTSE